MASTADENTALDEDASEEDCDYWPPLLTKRKRNMGESLIDQWTAIVLTCQERCNAEAFKQELLLRQRKGMIGNDVILLAVEDPCCNVGSGGATLNALLVVTEHISARQGYTVINPDVLNEARILIIHMGRTYPLDACGRAMLTLPLVWSDAAQPRSLVNNIDLVLYTMSHRVAPGSPPGLWVSSSDMILHIPHPALPGYHIGSAFCDADVGVLTVPGTMDYARSHGVYHIDKDGYLQDIIYRAGEEDIQACCLQDGKAPLVSGVVYFSPMVSEKLLISHITPPLDACTYMGQDSGASPITLSLYFDIMLSMCHGISEEDFVSGERSDTYGVAAVGTIEAERSKLVRIARALLWKQLHQFKTKAVLVPDGSHSYLEDAGNILMDQIHHLRLLPSPTWKISRQTHCFLEEDSIVSKNAIIINSSISSGVAVGPESIVSHSSLTENMSVGKRCIVSGLAGVKSHDKLCHVDDELIVQRHHIKMQNDYTGQVHIYTVFGLNDNIKMSINMEGSTFCNQPWSDFVKRTGISLNDLWSGNMPMEERCVFTAKLYPVLYPDSIPELADLLWMADCKSLQDKVSHREKSTDLDGQITWWQQSWRLSLKDILQQADMNEDFKWRRNIFYNVGAQLVRRTLLHEGSEGWADFYASAAVEHYAQEVLSMLDAVAAKCESHGIVARTLANIADVLGCLAGSRGGLRSGPASNIQWLQAFELLEQGKIQPGVAVLSNERMNWLGQPDLLVRAARHYERAAQILIRHAVMTAKNFIKTQPCEATKVNLWVTAESPARIDLAGGWSDTPPITYEHGGAVTNAALYVDGKLPIGARARRISEPKIILQLGFEEGSPKLELTKLSQFSDYSQPTAPGALLKTAFLCAEIISFPSSVNLKEQLMSKYNGGFELCTWSHLPHGSGMGTSSILAGVIMAALWRASGSQFDISSLLHAVLHVEQMLTTAGGWQDQVGGLTGGLKIGISDAKLPVHIRVEFPVVPPDVLQDFSRRLISVYTGKTRLARNLLQNVVRNWYARNEEIVETEDGLVRNAHDIAAAFQKGDMEEIGKCMDLNWEHKKKMAPGCEPAAIKQMITVLRPHIYGTCMAGAGGGGFLFVLMKDPEQALKRVEEILKNVEGCENASVHDLTINTEGFTLHVEQQGYEKVPISRTST